MTTTDAREATGLDLAALAEAHLTPVLGRYFERSWERGEGHRLYDTGGRGYLDFANGIAVSVLGHHHPAVTAAIHAQVDRMIAPMAAMGYAESTIRLADRLVATMPAPIDTVFFLNSGSEAIDMSKGLSNRNFDETVEVVFRLGVDPRKADQMVRGTVALPSGSGKDVRVAVFATGDAAREAEAAGAEFVGAEDLAALIEGGMMDFDVTIATPDLMPLVGRLGRALGPRGLMPNPKTGTVTNEVGKAVEEFKGGKVEYRTDRNGNVHVPLGKVSFEADALKANLFAVVEELHRAKPSSSKGRYLRKVTVSTTMGPGVRVDPQRADG